jgi:hypothetical protein
MNLMSLTSVPSELLLMIIAFLNTRDVVLLGRTCRRFHAIAEDERARRLDPKRYVDNPEHFRRLMRDTGGIIVGEFAKAFSRVNVPQRNWNKGTGSTVRQQESQDIVKDNNDDKNRSCRQE